MKLRIHIGHGKTGSSYLQSWFACNSKLLQENCRILYPLKINEDNQLCKANYKALNGFFSQGNGWILDKILSHHCSLFNRKELAEALSDYSFLAPESDYTLLFSFEGWTKNYSEIHDSIINFADYINSESIDVILVVRDPLDHACSVYSQLVKRHGCQKSLDEWLPNYRFTEKLLSTLRILTESSRVNLTVHHYNSVKRELLATFMSWLNIDSSCQWMSTPNTIVNRSLSLAELNLMRRLNVHLGEKSSIIGEMFVNKIPEESPATLVPSAQVAREFICKWSHHVQEINTLLPDTVNINLPDSMILELENNIETQAIDLTQAHLDCLVDGLLELAGLNINN